MGLGGRHAFGLLAGVFFRQDSVSRRCTSRHHHRGNGGLEAGVPLFLDDSLGLSSAAIGGVLLVMVLMQGLGSVVWGRWVDRHGPTRYMLIGWCCVVLSLLGVGLVGFVLTGNLAVFAMIGLLGTFQFFIAAAQVPMLPMIDTATNRALGEETQDWRSGSLALRGQQEPSLAPSGRPCV